MDTHEHCVAPSPARNYEPRIATILDIFRLPTKAECESRDAQIAEDIRTGHATYYDISESETA